MRKWENPVTLLPSAGGLFLFFLFCSTPGPGNNGVSGWCYFNAEMKKKQKKKSCKDATEEEPVDCLKESRSMSHETVRSRSQETV